MTDPLHRGRLSDQWTGGHGRQSARALTSASSQKTADGARRWPGAPAPFARRLGGRQRRWRVLSAADDPRGRKGVIQAQKWGNANGLNASIGTLVPPLQYPCDRECLVACIKFSPYYTVAASLPRNAHLRIKSPVCSHTQTRVEVPKLSLWR